MNDVWRGSVRVKDYPLDTPMWGVVDVNTQCKQVKAEICTGKLLLVQCMCSHMCSLPHSVQVQPKEEAELERDGTSTGCKTENTVDVFKNAKVWIN